MCWLAEMDTSTNVLWEFQVQNREWVKLILSLSVKVHGLTVVYQDLGRVLHHLGDPISYCTPVIDPEPAAPDIAGTLHARSQLKAHCTGNSYSLAFLIAAPHSTGRSTACCHLSRARLAKTIYSTSLPRLALCSHLLCPAVPEAHICSSILGDAVPLLSWSGCLH